MKFKALYLASLIAFAGIPMALVPVPAQAGAVVGATEITQIINMVQLIASYVEQAQQTVTQINQYQSMVRNLQQMTPSNMLNQATQKLWQDQNMNQTFMNLRKIVIGGEQISYSLSNLDTNFKKVNPGYSAYGNGFNYKQAYANWSDNTMGNVKNSLAMVNAQQDDFATERDMMNELQAKSQSAGGQLEATQAGHQIALSMVGQLQKLRQLQMAQMQAQDAYLTASQGKSDA